MDKGAHTPLLEVRQTRQLSNVYGIWYHPDLLHTAAVRGNLDWVHWTKHARFKRNVWQMPISFLKINAILANSYCKSMISLISPVNNARENAEDLGYVHTTDFDADSVSH